MLGRAWMHLLEDRGLACRGVDAAEVDITDRDAVRRVVLESRPSLLVNCAAWTDVDGAEAAEDEATVVNGAAVGYLADAAAEAEATMVHYSTDYVFDGSGDAPYAVDAERRPVNAYGRSKLAGELELESSRAAWLLARTSWLYAGWGKNFPLTIAGLARDRESLRVVADQRGRPSGCEPLAARTLALVEAGALGAHHLCDGGECTWFDFARAVVELTGAACEVEACGSEEYPRPAARPPYSVLDTGPADALIGEAPPWRASLEEALGRAGLLAGALKGYAHD